MEGTWEEGQSGEGLIKSEGPTGEPLGGQLGEGLDSAEKPDQRRRPLGQSWQEMAGG